MMHQPSGGGIGLRKEHYDFVLSEGPSIPWFEVISENFMGAGGRPRHILERVRRDYPMAIHGVSLSIGTASPPDPNYLKRLKELVDWLEPGLVSDHLCWTGIGGHNSHDLLPLPFTSEAVRNVARNVRVVQETLGRRILLENISTYIEFKHSQMSEWEFTRAVLEEADCHLLLDVNNIYVNARNHGIDPYAYLEGIPDDRVRQFHIAGHEDHGDFVIDTHDHPVCDEVWALYRKAVDRFGPQPTLIERDAHIPEFPVLQREAHQAQLILEATRAVPATL
jgi:uncharacterized protein (UPF0276 family)